jgi:hypothetical protein
MVGGDDDVQGFPVPSSRAATATVSYNCHHSCEHKATWLEVCRARGSTMEGEAEEVEGYVQGVAWSMLPWALNCMPRPPLGYSVQMDPCRRY